MEQILSENEVTIIDVRTPAEFMGGHVADSINIPLHEISGRLMELQQLSSSIIVCCASGQRSSQAAAYLKSQGFECTNGGSWLAVNHIKKYRKVKSKMRNLSVINEKQIIRWLKIMTGLYLAYQAYMMHDSLSGFMGAFLLLQAITNTGCCGTSACTITPNKEKTIFKD